MGDAFNNGRMKLDPKPYAPGSGGKTPLELAAANNLVGCWIATGRPNTAASRRVAAGAAIQPEHDIAYGPHPYNEIDGVCTECPLPPGHRIHHTDIQPTELDARVMGEREEENA